MINECNIIGGGQSINSLTDLQKENIKKGINIFVNKSAFLLDWIKPTERDYVVFNDLYGFFMHYINKNWWEKKYNFTLVLRLYLKQLIERRIDCKFENNKFNNKYLIYIDNIDIKSINKKLVNSALIETKDNELLTLGYSSGFTALSFATKKFKKINLYGFDFCGKHFNNNFEYKGDFFERNLKAFDNNKENLKDYKIINHNKNSKLKTFEFAN